MSAGFETRPLRGYAICTTGRSGSNFLCQLLTSTDVLGRPLEYFNGPARRALGLPNYPDDPDRQLAAVLSSGCTPNGVYGLKLFPRQFLLAESSRWTERAPGLSFVLLEREDLLGQAISWAKALQTRSYRSTSPMQGPAVYDGELIAGQLAELVREQARWRLWFGRTGVQPLRLTYESIAASPVSAVQAVADLVGLASAVRPEMTRVDLRMQRDEQSEEWRARFLAERGDRGRIAWEFSEAGVRD